MITLIRGLPGSGKSTLAKKMLSAGLAHRHCEADMWFEGREFNSRDLGVAHAWCRNNALRWHLQGLRIVVSNTFIQKWEIEQYLEIDPNATVIECCGDFGSIHNVPKVTIERMKARWESYP